MIYRRFSATGDYVFGAGPSEFLVNSPQAVAQAVQTRLALWLGDWFLNTTDGTAWLTQVLGVRTRGTRDAVIRARVLGTQGVTAITSYQSTYYNQTRAYDVIAIGINTVYGPGVVDVQIPSYVSN